MLNRWALFLSGRGSTAQAVMDLMDEVQVRWIVSSKPQVWGLARAKRQGIPTSVLSPKIDWNQLDLELRRRKITHIFLLGFMRLVPLEFVRMWQGRVWNVHPSLLPAFPGLQAIERSYSSRQNMGVTVHEVIAEMDAGRIVLQKKSIIRKQQETIDLNSARKAIARDEQRLVRDLVRMKNKWIR